MSPLIFMRYENLQSASSNDCSPTLLHLSTDFSQFNSCVKHLCDFCRYCNTLRKKSLMNPYSICTFSNNKSECTFYFQYTPKKSSHAHLLLCFRCLSWETIGKLCVQPPDLTLTHNLTKYATISV